MKNKLIRILLSALPVLITPLLASSCGPPGKPNLPNNNAKKYLSALAQPLKAQLDSIKNDVVRIATDDVNNFDISSYINNAIDTAKITAVAEGLDPSEINKIIISFQGHGNIQVSTSSGNNDILTAYPAFIGSKNSTSTLSTTLSLPIKGNDKVTQIITNNYDIVKGFKYIGGRGLLSGTVNDIYGTSDGTIYAATAGGIGVSEILNKTYYFHFFTKEKNKLSSNNVKSIYVSPDGKTIYAGTDEGLTIGTREGSDKYQYTFANIASLDGDEIKTIYVSPDGKTIYGGVSNGVIVGKLNEKTKQFDFQTYREGLSNNNVECIYVSPDGKTIYAGTDDGFATASTDNYKFSPYKTGLPSNIVYGISASTDGSIVYVASSDTNGGGVSVGTKSGDSYTFKDYTTQTSDLSSNRVNDIKISPDGSTIYAATTRGVNVGIKTGKLYKFTPYESVNNVIINRLYVSPDGNTIYTANEGAGINISLANWFTNPSEVAYMHFIYNSKK